MRRVHRVFMGALLMLAAGTASALPVISSTFFYTDRFGAAPGSLEGYSGVAGRSWLHLFTTVASEASPSSIQATAIYSGGGLSNGTEQNLTYYSTPILAGNNFEAYLSNFSLTGDWGLRVTDGTGTAFGSFPGIERLLNLPLLNNIQVVSNGDTPTITWSLPDMSAFGLEDAIRIRVLEAATGNQIFQYQRILAGAPPASYVMPEGILQAGIDYVFRIVLDDYGRDFRLENRSNTFSEVYSYAASIPEPETYTMLLAGLGLIAFWSRCRKQVVAAA